MKDASKSAVATLLSALSRFERAQDYQGLQSYLTSAAYFAAFTALGPAQRRTVFRAQFAAQLACDSKSPLPPRWSMRVRWTPEKVAALKRASRRHGDNFEAIARDLVIPVENARRAYYRYVKGALATAA